MLSLLESSGLQVGDGLLVHHCRLRDKADWWGANVTIQRSPEWLVSSWMGHKRDLELLKEWIGIVTGKRQ